MLLIQNIRLDWDKSERGATGENIRRRFPAAYPVERKPSGEVFVQNLYFYQEGTDIMDFVRTEHFFAQRNLPGIGFTQEQAAAETEKRIAWIKKHQYQSYPSPDALNLTNLSVRQQEVRLEIAFCYDEQRSGVPFRRGHNKDFLNPDSRMYRKDNLNEVAFLLAENQYGRVVWNERRVDYDLGTWYYELHIYNLFYSLEAYIPEDIFVKAEPDFVYRQLARLF